MTAVSVISSHSRSAGRPQPNTAAATCSGNSGSASCRADTLTDSTKSAPTSPRATQSPTSAVAFSSTHSPISPIIPISSATPMKAVGWITTSARAAATDERLDAAHLAGAEVHDRLVLEQELVA